MINLYKGDCLEVMTQIPDNSINMILCDLPYGVTAQNNWDQVIPFDKLWEQYERVITDNGCIALFSQDMFTAKLMLSNEKLHRYNLIWDKCKGGGFLNASRMPLRVHEDICIFYKKLPTYNPIKTEGAKNHKKGKNSVGVEVNKNNYGKFTSIESVDDGMKFPTSILSFEKVGPSSILHPTQKPVELLEYLIKTYTNEGMTVLDNCMGSGSTGVACINTKRNFIGIEKEKSYFEIASNRIKESLPLWSKKEIEIHD